MRAEARYDIILRPYRNRQSKPPTSSLLAHPENGSSAVSQKSAYCSTCFSNSMRIADVFETRRSGLIRRAPAILELAQPGSIVGSTINLAGLISGEHKSAPATASSMYSFRRGQAKLPCYSRFSLLSCEEDVATLFLIVSKISTSHIR